VPSDRGCVGKQNVVNPQGLLGSSSKQDGGIYFLIDVRHHFWHHGPEVDRPENVQSKMYFIMYRPFDLVDSSKFVTM
jgi:hypothetical protein